MTLIVHPLVQRDLREILDYYDQRSDRAGDMLFAELEDALDTIERNPLRFHYMDHLRRRCNLRRFPFHLVFEVRGELVGVTVLRHHRRTPTYGLGRKWG